MPIGTPSKDSPFSGTGTFVPHVIVRNLTAAAQAVTITIEYPGEDGPAQAALPPLPLEAYRTKDIPLDSVLGSLPLPLPFCSIRIQYSGPPGSVIGEVSSVESKGDLVIDSRLANERDGWAGSGGNPWHLDDETESILFLTNMGDTSCDVGFRVQAGGVDYFLTDLSLKSHETRAIDLRKLRDKQKPDFQGNKIPAAASDGSVLWHRLDDLPVMGRLVVLQRHKGMASNYDCEYCPCATSLWALLIDPASLGLLPTQAGQFLSTGQYQGCGITFYYDRTTNSSWNSLNIPVATVNNSTYKGRTTGVSPGTAPIQAFLGGKTYYWNGFACVSQDITPGDQHPADVVTVSISGPANVPLRASDSSGANTINLTAAGTPSGGSYSWSTTSSKVTLSNTTSATVTVTSASASTAVADVPVKVTYTYSGTSNTATQNISVVRPTSLNKTSDNTNPTGHTCDPNATQNTCQQSQFTGGGSYTSYVRNITYDIMDQFSPARPIKGFGLQNSESYTQPSGPCAGPIIVAQLSSGDTLIDCFYFCSETCRTGGSCNVSATQTIKSNGFVVATNNINWTCSSVSVP